MTHKDRFLVVFNPTAGKGAAEKRRDEISALLDASGLRWEMESTAGPGHAAELAKNAGPRGYDVVVSAGGDGTANEVVNGLMAASDAGQKPPAMAVLAIGRGNDFAYGADVPSSPEACVRALVKGHRRPLDVGLIKGGDYPEGKYFCNGIGIGFDTTVGLEAAKMKWVHGFMAYVLGAAKCFINFPDAPDVTITYNGASISRQSRQISIMNGKRMGGAFYMAPDAKNYDGLLDLCVSNKANRLQLLGIILHYARGSQGTDKRFICDRAPAYRIDAPGGGLIVHADGETICTDGTLLEISCLPGRLSAIYDPEISR